MLQAWYCTRRKGAHANPSYSASTSIQGKKTSLPLLPRAGIGRRSLLLQTIALHLVEHALKVEWLQGFGEATKTDLIACRASARAPVHPGLEQLVEVVERIVAGTMRGYGAWSRRPHERINGGKVQDLRTAPSGITRLIVARVEASTRVRYLVDFELIVLCCDRLDAIHDRTRGRRQSRVGRSRRTTINRQHSQVRQESRGDSVERWQQPVLRSDEMEELEVGQGAGWKGARLGGGWLVPRFNQRPILYRDRAQVGGKRARNAPMLVSSSADRSVMVDSGTMDVGFVSTRTSRFRGSSRSSKVIS